MRWPARNRTAVALEAAFLICAVASLAAPAAALAHPELVATRPADGDTLRTSPETIRLLFNEPVELALTEARLLGGGAELLLALRGDPADPNAILGAVPRALEPGSYQVAWRVLSADGHVVQGAFVFVVEATAGTAGPADGTGPAAAPPTMGGPAMEASTPWALGLLRGAAVGALLAFAGLLAFGAWLARPTPAPGLARALAVAAVVLLAAHAVAWVGHASPRGVDAQALEAALATRPGRLEAVRLVFAALALGALFLRRDAAAAVLALAATAVTAGLGHSLARSPIWSIPAKAVHVLAATAWLGGLLHLAAGGLRRESRMAGARRVSSVALAAVLAIALTGLAQTVLNLSTPADLVRSTYGILVLAKAAGLGVLVLFGARNRLVLLPGLETEPSDLAGGRLERSVRWEILVMAIVVLAAGLLAYTPLPSDLG